MQLTRDSGGISEAALWLYVARVRSDDRDAVREFQVNAAKIPKQDHDYPAVELFLGRRTPEATLAAGNAVGGDRCSAYYYVGLWYLMRSAQDAAAFMQVGHLGTI